MKRYKIEAQQWVLGANGRLLLPDEGRHSMRTVCRMNLEDLTLTDALSYARLISTAPVMQEAIETLLYDKSLSRPGTIEELKIIQQKWVR